MFPERVEFKRCARDPSPAAPVQDDVFVASGPYSLDVILSGRQAAKDLARVGRAAVDWLVQVFPVGGQVVPVGIRTVDQLGFLGADPALDSFSL